jgi:acyl carrier protein
MEPSLDLLSPEALTSEVMRILSKQLGSEITASTDLIATGLLDSVGVVRLLSEIEHRLRVSIPVSNLDIDDLRSVSALARTIARNLTNEIVDLPLPEAVSKP